MLIEHELDVLQLLECSLSAVDTCHVRIEMTLVLIHLLQMGHAQAEEECVVSTVGKRFKHCSDAKFL